METCSDARFDLAPTLNFLFSPLQKLNCFLRHENNHLSLI